MSDEKGEIPSFLLLILQYNLKMRHQQMICSVNSEHTVVSGKEIHRWH